jgi:hypothetical protein
MICFNLIYSHDALDDIDENMGVISNEIMVDANTANKECNICLERFHHQENVDTNRLVFFIKHEYSNFIKKCECDCYVHSRCLSAWFINKRSCIICRIQLQLQEEPRPIVRPSRFEYTRLLLKCLYMITRIMQSVFIISTYAYLVFIGYIIIKVSLKK